MRIRVKGPSGKTLYDGPCSGIPQPGEYIKLADQGSFRILNVGPIPSPDYMLLEVISEEDPFQDVRDFLEGRRRQNDRGHGDT